MRILLSIQITLLLAFTAEANECSFIENGIERLACFDEMFPRPDAEVEERSAETGEWSIRSETSAMTDDTDVYLTVESMDPIYCSWNRGERVTLMLRCQENTTSIIFITGCHMTSSRYNDYGDVTYRLDDEDPQVRGFEESTNNRALGLWRGAQAIPFIRAMLDNQRLLARMTPYSENPMEMEFNISGLEEAIVPLRDACNW